MGFPVYINANTEWASVAFQQALWGMFRKRFIAFEGETFPLPEAGADFGSMQDVSPDEPDGVYSIGWMQRIILGWLNPSPWVTGIMGWLNAVDVNQDPGAWVHQNSGTALADVNGSFGFTRIRPYEFFLPDHEQISSWPDAIDIPEGLLARYNPIYHGLEGTEDLHPWWVYRRQNGQWVPADHPLSDVPDLYTIQAASPAEVQAYGAASPGDVIGPHLWAEVVKVLGKLQSAVWKADQYDIVAGGSRYGTTQTQKATWAEAIAEARSRFAACPVEPTVVSRMYSQGSVSRSDTGVVRYEAHVAAAWVTVAYPGQADVWANAKFYGHHGRPLRSWTWDSNGQPVTCAPIDGTPLWVQWCEKQGYGQLVADQVGANQEPAIVSAPQVGAEYQTIQRGYSALTEYYVAVVAFQFND